MHLRVIELRDWRSYRHARFEFPIPKEGRNVILIRGANEYGKTSLFEAITLGLFGRNGLRLVPRVRIAAADNLDSKIDISYSNFLEQTLHRKAISRGRQSCSVTLEFEDDDGESIEVKRTWHFYTNGKHKRSDDELMIFDGKDRHPIRPPAIETDSDEWYREFISQRFIPPHLAEFFLFDGEQVQRYAKRDMAEQIREGIEGLLGLHIFRSLRESLRNYERAKNSKIVSPTDATVKDTENKITHLEAELRRRRKIVQNISDLLPGLQSESDEIAQHIGSGSTVARVSELIKDEKEFESKANQQAENLREILAGDAALALCGAGLRKSTIEQLKSEKKRENWETGRDQGNRNLERYLADLLARLHTLEPPIPDARKGEIVKAAHDSWNALWHPAPDGCAEDYLHLGLMGATRDQALARLENVAQRSTYELTTPVKQFFEALSLAEDKKRSRLALEQMAPEIEQKTARLREVLEEVGAHKNRRETTLKEIESLEGKLAAHRQELGRYVESKNRDAPTLRYTKCANVIANLIDSILAEAVPTQVNSVAQSMTTAWKSMAHMQERISRIEITPDCEVRMLNDKGQNLHDIEKSAGASQIFAQALICAIARVSGQDFPFIVDTPLARLSREHRFGVLKTFLDREGQVILLSTDEEIVGEKLDAIRDRIAVALQLRVQTDDGIIVTTVEQDTIQGRGI